MADRGMTNEEAIEILGGIRACYNIFDEYDEPKYAALSKAIFALKAEKGECKMYNPIEIARQYAPKFDKPAVDMVAVVRCKDCKFWSRYDDVQVIGSCIRHGCIYTKRETDFCSWGERKDEVEE